MSAPTRSTRKVQICCWTEFTTQVQDDTEKADMLNAFFVLVLMGKVSSKSVQQDLIETHSGHKNVKKVTGKRKHRFTKGKYIPLSCIMKQLGQ